MSKVTFSQMLVAGITIAGLSLSPAWADSSYRSDRGHGAYAKKGGKGHGRLDFAKVVAVEPITQSYSRKVPYQECWTEQVRYDRPVGGGYRSNTPAILGGVIGALAGRDLGRHNHKDTRALKAIAGGLLGASIGRDLGSRSQPQRTVAEYRNEERCETRYDTQWEERITGYDVRYRYRGETYNTRMDYDPGEKIRVRVQVRPVL